MAGKIRWDRINAVGYTIETFLSQLVVVGFLVVLILLLAKAEWQLLPLEARAEVLCGAEIAATAPFALVAHDPAESVRANPAGWPDYCASAIPSRPESPGDDDLSGLWAVPVTLSLWEDPNY